MNASRGSKFFQLTRKNYGGVCLHGAAPLRARRVAVAQLLRRNGCMHVMQKRTESSPKGSTTGADLGGAA